MTTSTADAAISEADEQVTPDASTLDRYIGYYFRNRALGVSTITRKDTKLVLEPIGQPALELEQTGEADFVLPKFDLVLHFEQIEDGAAKRLVIWHRGTALRLERTDAETRQGHKADYLDRIKDRIPRRAAKKPCAKCSTGRAGNLNYDLMSPEFAQVAGGSCSIGRLLASTLVRSCRSSFCASAIRDGTSTKFSMKMTFISTASPWAMTARSTALARRVLQRTNAPWYEPHRARGHLHDISATGLIALIRSAI